MRRYWAVACVMVPIWKDEPEINMAISQRHAKSERDVAETITHHWAPGFIPDPEIWVFQKLNKRKSTTSVTKISRITKLGRFLHLDIHVSSTQLSPS